MKPTDKGESNAPVITTCCEKQIGKTLYRVTNIYKGEIDLKKALEDLTIRKITLLDLCFCQNCGGNANG